MDISIIIVSWRVKEKLRANLEALSIATESLKAEIFVVDNNSQDGTAEMIRVEFPQVTLIANQENLGFARANNQAIRLAQGDFILLLNPDMQVFPDTIVNSLSWTKNNPQATVTGIHLQDEQGKTITHVRRFPKLFDQAVIVLKLPHLFPFFVSRYLQKNFNYTKAQKVDSIRGSFFLINRQSWQKISDTYEPFLDERYFIWFEEVDFCKQVYQYGGEVWYSPSADCLDYVAGSFSQVQRGLKQKYFRSSMLQYFRKWCSKKDYYILKSLWRVSRLLVKVLK